VGFLIGNSGRYASTPPPAVIYILVWNIETRLKYSRKQRAVYSIQHEDEADGAKDTTTGQLFSVELEGRGVLGQI
jgi:hypothetical protein